MDSHPRKRKLLSVGIGARGIIAVGIGAHGIIAIGVSAHGIIAIGINSMGIISIGAVSMGLASIGAVSMGLATVAPMGMGLFFKFPKQEMPSMEMHSRVEQDLQRFIDLGQREEKAESILSEFPLQGRDMSFPNPCPPTLTKVGKPFISKVNVSHPVEVRLLPSQLRRLHSPENYSWIESLKFNENDLIPTIAQDY